MAESARFANNASATLASSITDSDTTLTVTTGQGALFPSVSLGVSETFFYGTLVDTSGNIEIVKCTVHNGSSDSFTISRAQESTTARSFSAGDLFELRITAGGLTNIRSNWAATDGTGTGIEYITFDTSGTGACINTSSTGSTRKILSNSGTNSYYAFGISPYLQFKTNLSFFDNTSAEPGTLCATISSSGISTTATVSTSVLSVTGNSTLGNDTSDTVTVGGYFSGTTSFGTSAWPSSTVGKSQQRVLVGGEGVSILWNETVGAGNVATLYLGTKHASSATQMGLARIQGGTEGTDYASFYKVATMNGAGSITDHFKVDSSGNVLTIGTGGLGYGTGSGGSVTQGTSRTTGVTLNKSNGAITLISAAGTTSWQSFTLTNSLIAATDTIIVNQKSGTDKYMIHVTAVAAGSCQITYATTGGTTTEQPVFNFAIIKGVTS